MATSTAQDTSKTLRESEKKWGKPAIAAGFTLFPSTLLLKQHALGLDCIDLVIILQILKHWWHADSAPFPSQVQLAKTMNVDLSTVKRHLTRLKSAGLVTWTSRANKHGGQASNAYDMTGLIKHVQDFAVAELAERQKADDARKARNSRKRPLLRVVKGDDADGQ
jgi:DNA-binding transcriptional regulator YhcF (GntR family)